MNINPTKQMVSIYVFKSWAANPSRRLVSFDSNSICGVSGHTTCHECFDSFNSALSIDNEGY